MKQYNVLVVGSGAREHALSWKISQSKWLNNLYITPGNLGTALCGTNLNIPVNEFENIKKVLWEKAIDIVVIGPEDPLVKGLADAILEDKVLSDVIVIGPRRAGAMLEGSKAFAKAFMQKYGIPTARYQRFEKSQEKEALDFLEEMKAPYVIKADGLAAGKGVVIAETKEQAVRTIQEMFAGKFGKASETLVVEEFLKGIEVSYFVLCHEEQFVLLPEAKDYKRIGENDTGLNTGGMGTVSPASGVATNAFTQKVIEKIVIPSLHGLKAEGISYCGFIFFGLMNVDGEPYVIEYNCRLGDPETESILLRIESDLVELFVKTGEKQLSPTDIKISEECAATVILASKGYPETFEKDFEIKIEEEKIVSHIFHAGTSIKDGRLVTNGGRVLAVSSIGKSLEEALQKSYQSIEHIHFENKYFRKDIGQDILKMNAQKV